MRKERKYEKNEDEEEVVIVIKIGDTKRKKYR